MADTTYTSGVTVISADTMNDLDDRIRRHLEDEGGRNAA